jgi:ribosomal protein S18 acetylase RimI-like enzyme
MNSVHFSSSAGEHTVVISRVAHTQWHALEDDRVVGRGEVSRRPDGRLFLSVDAWHGAVFDLLAGAMLAGLPRPLYTVVDEADVDLTAQWERTGLTAQRREWEYVMPTDPGITGLGTVLPPAGVTIVPAGAAEQAPLRTLDRLIRDEVEATVGWLEMPAEVLPRPDGDMVLDPAIYTVAAQSDRYVGLVRVAPLPRRPRIRLIAVRASLQRRGVARALLAHVLGSLHLRGVETASADVNESNPAATALFERVGARRAGSTLELVLH